MIRVDIVLAISIYLCFSLCLVFILWVFYNFSGRRTSVSDETNDLQQCPYCTYVFRNYQKGEVYICPQCKSYIAVEDKM